MRLGANYASTVGSIAGAGSTFTVGVVRLWNGSISGSNTFTSSSSFYINYSGATYPTMSSSISGSNTFNTPSGSNFQMGYANGPSSESVVSGSNTFNTEVYMYSGTFSGSNTINGNSLGCAGC